MFIFFLKSSFQCVTSTKHIYWYILTLPDIYKIKYTSSLLSLLNSHRSLFIWFSFLLIKKIKANSTAILYLHIILQRWTLPIIKLFQIFRKSKIVSGYLSLLFLPSKFVFENPNQFSLKQFQKGYQVLGCHCS